MLTNMDESQVLETETTEAEQDNTVEAEETQEDDVEAIKAELEKERAEKAELEKKNKQLYERAKKAEKSPAIEGNLTAKDILALKDADISAQDLDEVQDFAKYRKISIAEALESKTLRTILAERKEERRTAQATETKSPRGIAKVTGEDLLRKAETTGEVKESDIDALIQARLERKRNKLK